MLTNRLPNYMNISWEEARALEKNTQSLDPRYPREKRRRWNVGKRNLLKIT